MSDFSDHWLALRAAADAAARADGLVEHLLAWPPVSNGALEVLDLGCGTGANLRHLAPLLAAAGHGRQRWMCVDHDPDLLERLPARMAAWGSAAAVACARANVDLRLEGRAGWSATVRTRTLDLQADLGNLAVPSGGLVTASALLDLVSAPWLDALLGRCRAGACALLFVLSYDGRCSLSPAHADDAAVIGLLNRHQRTDKGFGPALGPDAAAAAARRCRALGWHVHTSRSDWDLGADASGLQRALLAGWRDAAAAFAGAGPGCLRRSQLDAWLAQRLAWVADGASRLRVGHLDLLALPGTAAAA